MVAAEHKTKRQAKRLDEFRNSLSLAYQYFDVEKFPMPDLALSILDQWQSRDTKHAGSKYADSDRPGLIFYGPPRQGKTILACELARRAIIQEGSAVKAVFLSAVEWSGECSQKAKNCELPGWNRRILSFGWNKNDVSLPILILDDLDKIRTTAAIKSELFNLIELATSNEFALIVTTNVNSNGLIGKLEDEALGQAIVARLQEFCVPVNFSTK